MWVLVIGISRSALFFWGLTFF
uniref:Uncharacterized protein n=1 Tax=Arundo donax TaxID=35708 RepID=A0A0A9GSK4_ARUDO